MKQLHFMFLDLFQTRYFHSPREFVCAYMKNNNNFYATSCIIQWQFHRKPTCNRQLHDYDLTKSLEKYHITNATNFTI